MQSIYNELYDRIKLLMETIHDDQEFENISFYNEYGEIINIDISDSYITSDEDEYEEIGALMIQWFDTREDYEDWNTNDLGWLLTFIDWERITREEIDSKIEFISDCTNTDLEYLKNTEFVEVE